jgi:hypothetical protein
MTEEPNFAMGGEIFRISRATFLFLGSMHSSKVLARLVFLVLLGAQAHAQYFARNSVQLPSVGWMAMDSTMGTVNPILWGLNDQVQIGTGYGRDLYDLRLWWVTETAIGFAGVNYPGAPSSRIAITFEAETGVKYNFLNQRWRPFVGFMVGFLQIFNAYRSAFYPYLLTGFSWGTIRPMVGLEWIFTNDMSFELESGYVLLTNFENPVRHSVMARLGYRVHF